MPSIITIHGNNLDYLPDMEDNSYDLLLDDPQYGIKESAHRNISRSKLAKTKLYRKEIWDQEIPPQEYFDHAFRVSKHQIIFGINYFLGRRNIPFSSGRIIWDKVNGESNFSDCEIAYSSFHHSTRMFRFMWNGMLQGKSCSEGHLMQGNKGFNQKRIHPTEKPVELYKWILLKYAKKGYRILEAHAGSFSLALAVEYFNKHHDMELHLTSIEKDQVYYNDGTKRLKEKQQQAVLI
jgi:site-specific DNA-methyltransferase (adenine-specific)